MATVPQKQLKPHPLWQFRKMKIQKTFPPVVFYADPFCRAKRLANCISLSCCSLGLRNSLAKRIPPNARVSVKRRFSLCSWTPTVSNGAPVWDWCHVLEIFRSLFNQNHRRESSGCFSTISELTGIRLKKKDPSPTWFFHLQALRLGLNNQYYSKQNDWQEPGSW